MTAQEIAKYRAQSTNDQATIMHEAMKLMPDYGNDAYGIAALMATAYNAGRAEAETLPDNGDAQGFYLQGIVNASKQITDAGTLKRIYNLARRLLGKNPEQPAEQNTGRALDMANLLRHAIDLNDTDLHRVYIVARTLAQMAQEAGDGRNVLIELVNDEMAGVVKPKTLDVILSYARIARQREGRE